MSFFEITCDPRNQAAVKSNLHKLNKKNKSKKNDKTASGFNESHQLNVGQDVYIDVGFEDALQGLHKWTTFRSQLNAILIEQIVETNVPAFTVNIENQPSIKLSQRIAHYALFRGVSDINKGQGSQLDPESYICVGIPRAVLRIPDKDSGIDGSSSDLTVTSTSVEQEAALRETPSLKIMRRVWFESNSPVKLENNELIKPEPPNKRKGNFDCLHVCAFNREN